MSVTLLKCPECGALSMSAKSHQHRNEWIECEPIEFIESSLAEEAVIANAARGLELAKLRGDMFDLRSLAVELAAALKEIIDMGYEDDLNTWMKAEKALARFEKGVP